jgi:hypothetical protein
MKKVLIVSLLWLFAVALVTADIVGTDSFNYADGPIAGRNGGTGWDWKGNGNPQGSLPTSWQHQAGSTAIVNGRLALSDTGDGWISTRREFGSDTWGAGAFQNSGIVYFAATLTINDAQGWLGISAADGSNERVKFGMPWQSGGLGFLGINNENNGANVLSTVTATIGRPYRIVGVLDYTKNAARMWIDPDSGDYDTPDSTSADVVFNNLNMWNWINGVRIASGGSTTWDDVIIATTFAETFVPGSLKDYPHSPDPVSGAVDVLIDTPLSWTAPQDPNGLIDPNLVSMKLYMATAADPNFVLAADITEWDAQTLRASYAPVLSRDTTYFWRVDSVQDNAETVAGFIWTFSTEKSVPKITGNPGYQVVEAGATAQFSVAVTSVSPPTYQWVRYVDGVSDVALSDGGDISGAQTASLAIANAELADEGSYYCVVNNSSEIPAASARALLGIQRKIAYWPFEDNNYQSAVAGSPASVLQGDPGFVTGRIGNGMAFEGDLLYTNHEEVSYFDICNYTMSVSLWVKASSSVSWNPMVARHGDDGQGWQFRRHGGTANRICFTTRGTGNDDGTFSDRTVYDGNWHFAVATFDGVEKKVYIDGVLSRRYKIDDGTLDRDADAASGLINTTLSPVSLAGRVRVNAGNLTFEGFSPCVLDEVSIYNYALDAATIAQTYADVTGARVCPNPHVPAYDLDGDCRVNLNDVVRLAFEWLVDGGVMPALQAD